MKTFAKDMGFNVILHVALLFIFGPKWGFALTFGFLTGYYLLRFKKD